MSLDLSSTILDLIKSVNDVLENKLPLSGGTLTGALTTKDLTLKGIEQFQTHYAKKLIGALSAGTNYANLDSKYKDGTYHRMWRLRFPASCNFWGKIKITLYGGYSSFNASGIMSKSITCNFNGSSIYNNVGFYDGLGVNVEKDFRISEAIWNSTASAWEILIWQKNLNGNNSPTILLEAWSSNETYLTNAKNITAQAVELTQATTYTASKASSTGGTKTVTWATTPVYETPLGEEIATMSDIPSVPSVSVTQKLTSGTEIGSIKVGSTTTKLYAPTSAITIDDALSSTSTNPVQNKIINNALNERKNRIWYGVCETSAATTAKVGTCSGFQLYSGATILLKMTYTSTSTSNNTLNVNGTGAKTIYTSNNIPVRYTSTYTSSYQKPWSAGDYCLFTYDGTYWVWVNAPRTRMYYSNSTLYIYDN